MNELTYWLEWDDGVDYGFSGLRGAANSMYDNATGVQDYLTTLSKASAEERQRFENAIFETLYIMAAHNDKAAILSTFDLCPWLKTVYVDSDLLTPLDSAVENESLEAIDAFINIGMFDIADAMHSAIQEGSEKVVLYLMNYGIDAEIYLEEAITSTVVIRDALFNQIKSTGKPISNCGAVREAIRNSDIAFIQEVIGICTENVFSYCFEDGRCLLDYARSEQVKELLLKKRAIRGNPDVIQLLDINNKVYHLVNNVNNHNKFVSYLQTIENLEKIFFDMSHRNGQYDNWYDLCYSILKHGGFALFEQVLAILKNFKYISGDIYCAPFGMWVKWTHEDWLSYYRIAMALIAGGVKITCNPISAFCDSFKNEYINSLRDETKEIIWKLLELFYEQGVDINESQAGLYSYNPLASALFMGNEIGIKFLLNKGVKVVSKKENPLSFLTCSIASRDYMIPLSVMQELKNGGYDINETDEKGNTVLHRICRSQSPHRCDIVRALAYGADPFILDGEGKTAVDIARDNKLYDIISCLEQ